MGAIQYLMLTKAKNSIKRVLRRPGLLISYIIMLAVLVWMVVASFHVEASEQLAGADQWFRPAAVLTGLVILFLGINKGISQGTTFFQMADATLMFPAPLSSKAVLAYGIFQQMGNALMIFGFLLLQTVNIRLLLGLTTLGAVALMAVVALWMMLAQLVTMGVYCYAAGRPGRRKLIQRLLWGAVLLTAAGVLTYVVSSGDPALGVQTLFRQPFAKWIPVAGWGMAAVEGFNGGAWGEAALFTVLVLMGIGLAVWGLMRSDPDYYEDVLQNTEKQFAMLENKKAGRQQNDMSLARVRVGAQGLAGSGAAAIASKMFKEMARRGKVWIFDSVTLGSVFGVAVAAVAMRFAGIYGIFGMAVYMLMILTMAGPWMKELINPYIYLIPASPLAKIWAMTLPSVVKALADGVLVFGIAAVVYKPPFMLTVLMILAYGACTLAYLAGIGLSDRILKDSRNPVINMMVMMVTQIVLILPSVALLVILTSLGHPNLGMLALIGWNLLCGSLVLTLCKGMLSETETIA